MAKIIYNIFKFKFGGLSFIHHTLCLMLFYKMFGFSVVPKDIPNCDCFDLIKYLKQIK